MKPDRNAPISVKSVCVFGRTLWQIAVRSGLPFVLIAVAAANAQTAQPSAAINFRSVPLNTQSSSQTITFTFDVGGTIGTPVAVVLGETAQDFAVSGGTCTNGSTYSTGASCTVAVSFTPLSAGLRMGAVELVNTSGTTIATAYVYGVGTGSQIGWRTGEPSTWGSGLSSPTSVVVDQKDDVFVADTGNNAVKEIPQGCTSSSCVTTIGGGFAAPTGIALDGAGNVFVADTGNNAVKEIPQGCTSASCVTTWVTGFSAPHGIALDSSGNVYIADTGNSAVREIAAGTTAGCSVTSCPTDISTLGGGFVSPYGVAVNAAGTVYVADTTMTTIKAIPSGCTSANYGVGNCSVTDSGSGYSSPEGVALDKFGDLYIADTGNSAVKEDAYYIGPAMYFASTPVGSTSSDSPHTITLVNLGNQTLTFPLPSAGDNPSVSANFSWVGGGAGYCVQTNTSSSTAYTLAPGTGCTAAISFTPTTAGSITGDAVFTDNARNATSPNYTTQSISLQGTGLAIPTIALSSSVNPSTYATDVTLTATVSGSGATPTGTVSFNANGSSICTASLSSSGVAACTTYALPGGTDSIDAVYNGDSVYASVTSSTISQTVNPAALTLYLQSSGNPGVVNTPITFTVSTSASWTAAPPTGTVTFYDGATVLGTGTMQNGSASYTTSSLSIGTYTITATYGGDGNYQSATSSALSETIGKNVAIASIGVAPGTTEPGGTNVTFTDVLSTLGTQPTGTVTFEDGTTTLGTGTISAISDTNLLYESNGFSSASSVGSSPRGDDQWYVEAASNSRGAALVAYPTTSAAAVAGPDGEPISTGGAQISFPDTSSGGQLGSLYSGVIQEVSTTALAGNAGTFSVWLQSSSPATVVLYMADTASGTTIGTQVCNVGSTWARCSVTGTFPSTSTGATVSMRSWGATAETVNAWGTQLEQASTPGVYVQTTSTAPETGSGGIATFSTSTLAAGSHSITAVYGGDADFQSNTSPAVAVTITQIGSSVALTSSTSTTTFGDAITFTATVAGASITPTGTVSFEDGGTTLGTGTLNSSGVATFTTSALTGGTHSITAVYGGDSNYASSTSATFTETVNKALAVISAASTPDPSVHNQSVTFTVTVAPPSGVATTPTGTVTILNNGTSIGTGTLNSSGVATISTSTLPTGSDQLTVTYNGDTNFY